MVNARVEFLNIQFQAVLGTWYIFQCLPKCISCSMDAFPFNTGISICSERGDENRLHDVHNCMMCDPVRKVWKPEYFPFLWLINRKCGIGRCLICFILQHQMK